MRAGKTHDEDARPLRRAFSYAKSSPLRLKARKTAILALPAPFNSVMCRAMAGLDS